MPINVDGFENMIAGSLNLTEPWYVSGCEVDNKTMTMHIHVSVRDGAMIPCPRCGGETSRYRYENNERTWQHGNVFFIYPCIVHCRRPRVACPHCGVQQAEAPFARKESRHTLLFEGMALLIARDMPISRTAKLMLCNEKTVAGIMRYWVNEARGRKSLEWLTSLAVDETSMRRGHDYVTLFIDAEDMSVADVEPDREGTTLDRFVQVLAEKGGSASNVRAVSSDLSKAFVPAIGRNFPNAEHTVDKFHVKQIVARAVDEVRRQEQKEAEDKRQLFLGRLFIIPDGRLTESQRSQLAELSRQYPKTGKGRMMLEDLDEFYRSETLEEAERRLKSLCSWMRRCRLEPMKAAAKTLIRHSGKILNYFRNRLTNAICEDTNSSIQAAKRKTRGYKTFETFSTMIYLIAGNLDIRSPFPIPI